MPLPAPRGTVAPGAWQEMGGCGGLATLGFYSPGALLAGARGCLGSWNAPFGIGDATVMADAAPLTRYARLFAQNLNVDRSDCSGRGGRFVPGEAGWRVSIGLGDLRTTMMRQGLFVCRKDREFFGVAV